MKMSLPLMAFVALSACGKGPTVFSTLADRTSGGQMNRALKATDGTTIDISADRVINAVQGQYEVVSAANIHVRISNPSLPSGANVRVVLIDLCKETGTTSAPTPDESQADAESANGGYVASLTGNGPFGFELSSWAAGAQNVQCTQQIAIVVNGVWLSDPVNGTHNFSFQF